MRTHARLAVLGTLFAIPAVIFACVGDTPTSVVPSPDSGTDSTSPGDGGGDGGGSCSPACVGDASTFHGCDAGVAVETACDFGCVSTPNAHCGVFNPPGPVEPGDFTTANLTDVSLCAADAGPFACSYVFHTDTGVIDGFSALRPSNANPTALEVGNGIGFRIASYDAGTDKLAIFSFKSLHMLGGKIHFVGPNPVAFVATNDIEVRGIVDTLDTSFGCQAAAGGGPRGYAGDASLSTGGGGGGSGATNYYPGGGGGGSAGNGGAGGAAGFSSNGGAAGPAFSEGFNPLRGGGGGGGGGDVGNAPSGGAGGGAIALFANGTTTVAPGGGPQWGINAGGCPGYPASNGGSNGGAGAGGAILVEGRTVIEVGPAGLAANGGSAGSNGLGTRGALSTSPAIGPDAGSYAGTCYGKGGNGAAGSTPATAGQSLLSGCTTYYPGGGGGGIGRIGVGSFAPGIVDGGFILSPTPTPMPLPIE